MTASYNQGRYIEETIRSVLLQGYPSLEYIVIDGGSTDETLEIIRKYEPWLAYWVSERDEGQAHAINKGLDKSTGEVFQFINSDDLLAPNALQTVAHLMQGHHAVAGAVIDFTEAGALRTRPTRMLTALNFLSPPGDFLYHQPGVWLRTELVRQLGGFDTGFHYKFDWLLQVRYVERWPRVAYTDRPLAHFRLHDASKTLSQGDRFLDERYAALDLLALTAASSRVRRGARKIMNHRRWRRRIQDIAGDSGLSKTGAVLRLLGEASRDPVHRFDRYTFGAARQLVRSILWSPPSPRR